MTTPPLIQQTVYAELLERCAADAFAVAFTERGVFTAKIIRDRRYWYFQTSAKDGRTQRYVGPETPELLERISRHNQSRQDERERRALIATLIRSVGLPRPVVEIGNIIGALAKAGVFRLRGVLVGTTAYQSYAAMLGSKLPSPLLQTADVDIAQFKNISVAIKDQTPPMIDVLKEVDATFRSVPGLGGARSASYATAKGGWRVDFLTPNEGRETERPQPLPALQTDAQPLRFLDFLIHEPEPAVILHGAGIYVLVPAPERYAVHKLIVARRRHTGTAKWDKDIAQAAALIEILAQRRPHELKSAWQEASARGRSWKQLLSEGASLLPNSSRAILQGALGERPKT